MTIPVTSQAQNDILSQNVWTTIFGNASNFLHSPGYPEDENDNATDWYSMTNATTHHKPTENVDQVSSAHQDQSPSVPLSITSPVPLHSPVVSPTAPIPQSIAPVPVSNPSNDTQHSPPVAAPPHKSQVKFADLPTSESSSPHVPSHQRENDEDVDHPLHVPPIYSYPQATDDNNLPSPLQDSTASIQQREEPSQQREPKQREPALLPPPILSAP